MAGKRRKAGGIIGAVAVIVITLLLISGVLVLVLTRGKGQIKGKWVREVEITNSVKAAASEWLSTALMSEEVNIDEYIPDCRIEIVLSINDDGSWGETLDEESYNQCRKSAYDGLAQAFESLASKRLDAAGKDVSDVDALISETINMTLDEYLRNYGPELLPAFETLNKEILSGGKYKVKGDTLYRSNDLITDALDGEATTYLCNSGALVLANSDESPILYTKEEEK